MSENILSVQDLHMSFYTSAGEVKAVNGVSFNVRRGEILGIVGESGSGKSTAMLSIIGLQGANGKIKSGEIIFDGHDISTLNMNEIRGKKISMIFQDPMTSLNPVLSIGYQLEESLKRHKWQGNIRERSLEMLERVGIVPAVERIKQYPHEFSGGQSQRIMIAMAMICKPDLLIADEPTTALDVTVQAQILKLMKDLQRETKMSIILITHDLGVIAGTADRILIMYGGKIMEQGTRREIFYSTAHPYTKGLLKSVPNPEKPKERLIPIEGQPPDLLNPPKGCPYVQRCPQAMKVCLEHEPEPCKISESHFYSCWRSEQNKKGYLQ
ncbi:MAG: ABC transporter ATP-binding protein [Synergistales bacterium]|nr:ABC transporter ATP-binding protein [Synergistales bacterium]MDY6401021.1 ABC transporter ATP-binding protein [Synergistales bacterium]MDY6404045.1 ABC transporter ATP-binding protein [Synergistales bacterium]MDY6411050.1 ABC transporter ATP-binding protein [Synergistales bacterium]MDY6414922.1 ABC transporter ATP-binding protein [Synergistales bacterium]